MTKILANNTTAVLLLAAVLIIISILLLNLAFQDTMDGIEWHEEIYRIKAGDSLWTIAGTYCPESVDRREWIEEVRGLNGLQGSVVRAGQEIIVLTPAKEG